MESSFVVGEAVVSVSVFVVSSITFVVEDVSVVITDVLACVVVVSEPKPSEVYRLLNYKNLRDLLYICCQPICPPPPTPCRFQIFQ